MPTVVTTIATYLERIHRLLLTIRKVDLSGRPVQVAHMLTKEMAVIWYVLVVAKTYPQEPLPIWPG